MTRVVAGINNSNGLLDKLPKQNANPLDIRPLAEPKTC